MPKRFRDHRSAFSLNRVDIQVPEFPVIVRNVDITNLPRLKREIEYSNRFLENSITSIYVAYRHKSMNSLMPSSEGHERINLGTEAIQKALLSAGKLWVDSQIRRVNPLDPSRMAIRSYKCHRYGHFAKHCCSSQDVCGKCAEPQLTRSCTKPAHEFRCATCSQNHQTSDRFRIVRQRAANRLQPFT